MAAADVMLPGADALAEIRSLSDACAWAGVSGAPGDPRTLPGALTHVVGGYPTLYQLARLPRSAIEALISSLRVSLELVEGAPQGAEDGAEDAQATAALTRPHFTIGGVRALRPS